MASLPLREDGCLGPVTDLLLLPGEPGPHRAEQTGAKPHQVSLAPDGRFLVVPDPVPHAATREMAGPRRICFHPTLPYAYTIDELRSTVATYRWDAARGALDGVQTLPSTPPSAAGDSRGGEIAVSPDGQFAYASNRGGAGDGTPGGPEPDTIGAITTFDVDADSGAAPAVRRGAGHEVARVHRVLAAAVRSVRDSRRGTPRMKCPRPPHEERRG